MIQEYVNRFMDKKEAVKADFKKSNPSSYEDILKAVIVAINQDEYSDPDFSRIHSIDDGAYQGMLVFVVASGGYQPSKYFYTKVSYGSCSGCDTLQRIMAEPDEEKPEQYWTLALHMLQNLKIMGDEE